MRVEVGVLSDFLKYELESFDGHFFADKGNKSELALLGVPGCQGGEGSAVVESELQSLHGEV